MDIEGQGNEIVVNENLNPISTITALETLSKIIKEEVWCG